MYVSSGRNFLWRGTDVFFADIVRFLKKFALGLFDSEAMLLDNFKHSSI